MIVYKGINKNADKNKNKTMSILKHITTYLNWRNIRFLALIVVGVFLLSDLAFADPTTTTPKTTAQTDAGAWINAVVNILVR